MRKSVNCQTWVTNNLIKIGKNILIGRNCFIGDNIHGYENVDMPIIEQPLSEGDKVIIEDDCWIGTGVCILPNVRIGKHCVIGANSVVTKNILPYTVAVGVPAKVIKKFIFDGKRWLKI